MVEVSRHLADDVRVHRRLNRRGKSLENKAKHPACKSAERDPEERVGMPLPCLLK